MKILVTGGLGFIGSHIIDSLVSEGHEVRSFDNLEYQVHLGKFPAYANPSAEYFIGDLRDRTSLKKALDGIEVVFHEAAAVGVGQSMYEISKYISTNCLGTANILDIIANDKTNIKKLIVASSMSIYGEGGYTCNNCGEIDVESRSLQQLKEHKWESFCPSCNNILEPLPTRESKTIRPSSIYATSKRDQEELFLVFGRSYGIPTVALRYFNGYGARQSLSNPYTGACAIFCSRYKNNQSPLIYEDGLQLRDFVHISDIVKANLLAMSDPDFDFRVLNVASGEPITVLELASIIQEAFGSEVIPQVIGKFRAGDIRHCFADISQIKELGFQPQVSIQSGIKYLIQHVQEGEVSDLLPTAFKELEKKGLIF